jgi:hypothetical protein
MFAHKKNKNKKININIKKNSLDKQKKEAKKSSLPGKFNTITSLLISPPTLAKNDNFIKL